MTTDFPLPPDLPPPRDDGACNHLTGMPMPSLRLPSTHGGDVDLAGLRGRTSIYCYPATGTPGVPLPSGWNEIPGARGCTPQSCAFRDHHDDLTEAGVTLFGLSAQRPEAQAEAAARLDLNFPLLSDTDFQLIDALRLPTFVADGRRFSKRVTLVLLDGVIDKVFYPVFPPQENPREILEWLARAP
jgi:peroxiredoxin